MIGRAPAFWWREAPTLPARLLTPLGALYGAITAGRMARPGLALGIPVVCVGNFVAGGAGKTPTAIAIARRLRALGHAPAFLSRGYGRLAPHPDEVIRVVPERHGPAAVGDEPLLLARVAPTFVARDRVAGARAALADRATVLVLDDGLQNPALRKDLALAVVDGAGGVGNGLCVPAGPLRAPLERQWPCVSLAVIIGDGVAGDRVAAAAGIRGVPVLRARLRPDPDIVRALSDTPLLAFAGIGRPEKFFATLERQGLRVVGRRSFPDHHAYAPGDLRSLAQEAARLGAGLVTTEKDRVRLPPGFDATALPVALDFDQEGALDALLGGLRKVD